MVNILPINKLNRAPRWRLNSSLLLDSAQITLFKETDVPAAPSVGVALEAMEAFLRGYVIQHATFKKKQSMVKQIELGKQIQIAENTYEQDMSVMSPNNLTMLTHLKYQFNTILINKDEYALFRARQKQTEEGNKAGKMLAKQTDGEYECHSSN